MFIYLHILCCILLEYKNLKISLKEQDQKHAKPIKHIE